MGKCSREQHDLCINNAKCALCDGQRLFKKPKWMELKDRQDKRKAEGIKKKPKEGMDFEKRVQKTYNKRLKNASSTTPKSSGARRRPNSGAIWSMPGDIISEEELFECKERGSTTGRGEKTISIPKSHLDKVKQEAYQANKNTWYYVFGYKESPEIYLVKDFEDELRLIQQIGILKERVLELESKLGDDAEC